MSKITKRTLQISGIAVVLLGCLTLYRVYWSYRAYEQEKSTGLGVTGPEVAFDMVSMWRGSKGGDSDSALPASPGSMAAIAHQDTEEYGLVSESAFRDSVHNPLSTFSIDVDTASYARVRRFLQDGQLPPPEAVRIEELINYFRYEYPDSGGEAPFSITADVTGCPWKPEHRLMRIGLRSREIESSAAPPSNLVFLIDVSGSMEDADKLPLLKRGFGMLIEQLRAEDSIAIVTYAGAAGLVLDSTSGADKVTLIDAISRLEAGGSTAGGDGLRLAYRVAEKTFRKGGNNRVILATDGDFNVGESSDGAMVRLIEEKRKSGVFLTVLGFGTGNLKDSKMEQIADHGDGNYSYIDSLAEARRVLVSEIGATLVTVAKDVKIQVEFNPAMVRAYRLIGYENRLLAAEDFNDDAKDAGEMGAGHHVTALYEIAPHGVESPMPVVDELKYQEVKQSKHSRGSGETATIKVRYKDPDGGPSRLLSEIVRDSGTAISHASADLRFAAAVAEMGMLLRNDKFKGEASFDQVLSLIAGGHLDESRAGFHDLVLIARRLSQ